MQTKTIKQLNGLNQQFYSQTSEYFNNSRQYYWSGWEKLLPTLKKKFADQTELHVIDLGCGNGRFGDFLCERVSQKIYYLGVDSNTELLKEAEERFKNQPTHCIFKTQREDIVTAVLSENLLHTQSPNSQDLIVMFGVWHHIPSQALREKLLHQLTNLLKPTGLLIFTAWKFYEYERFKNKIITPETVGIPAADLEEHDYILDWQRGTEAFRYCHYSTDVEIKATISKIPYLKQINTFRADGKQQDINQYILLENNP